MTSLLASVRSLDEARIALEAGADIIDLKEPLDGALGAVPPAVARAVSDWVGGRVPVSATIGDLHGDSRAIVSATEAMAACGVDILKVGLFEMSERAATLAALAPLARGGARLVAVLFADRCDPGDVADIDDIASAGFFGAMIDTAGKGGPSLRRCLDDDALAAFVHGCRRAGLFSGLAGSLRIADIGALLPLAPDYLGFRGALCRDDVRGARIDRQRIAAVRGAIPGRSIDAPNRLGV
jgi:uncharacterized protein (UPF0264 family)